MVYGNSIIKKITQAGGYTDTVGVYHPGAETTGQAIVCDVVPNGRATETRNDDGKAFNYSYEVTLDVGSGSFEIGDRIAIQREGNTEVIASVVGFHRYAFVCKLWAV